MNKLNSTPTDLNAILFSQLDRLQNTTDLDAEIQRTEAIEKISEQIIKNNTTRLSAAKLIAQYKGMKNVEGVELPQTLIG